MKKFLELSILLLVLITLLGCAVSGGLIGVGLGMVMDPHHPGRGALIGGGIGTAIGLEADRSREYSPTGPVYYEQSPVYIAPPPVYYTPRHIYIAPPRVIIERNYHGRPHGYNRRDSCKPSHKNGRRNDYRSNQKPRGR